MVQLRLKLNSNRPSTIYVGNGKSYTLKPGTNVLNLEYDDYVALSKSLSLPIVEEPKQDQSDDTPVTSINDNSNECDTKDRASETKEEANSNECETKNDTHEVEEEASAELIDYTTWSFTKLKAEYRELTGKPCKLKKDEVISFLQEHKNA